MDKNYTASRHEEILLNSEYTTGSNKTKQDAKDYCTLYGDATI
ncbi:MAG TPA: hypothetical protein VFY41_07715 [Nitrososphaeraceae archaeon]|nr:hypothetical protein [Nitrososphaeraceae archaeon]